MRGREATARTDDGHDSGGSDDPSSTPAADERQAGRAIPDTDAVVTVPPTPSGLAAALSVSHAAHRTSGPGRSHPSRRGHPPLVRTGDDRDVPASIRAAAADTGIELVVPPSFDALFVLAPLAYYLQAEVRTEDREQAILRAPAADLERTLPAMPDLERAAARLLRRAFFLDCLVREVDRPASLAAGSLLDPLGLDPERLRADSPGERLATYCEVPHEAVERRLPDWHLSAYVDPVPENVETLPHLLNDLALVYQPRTSELDGADLVEQSLGGFYRAAGRVATVEVVQSELRSSRVHGWLADGVPIDVFDSRPAAYRNRARYDDDGPTEVVVVLNDEQMYDEHDDVGEIYRERAGEIPLSVKVHEHLSTERLASVFESGSDLVHYIGHCEAEGLRCPNGHMAAADLSECNARTFFLNACGSYYEGRALVDRGAVAGAITFSQVLDDHATRVGAAFARLLVHGFSVERALQIARRRIMMGKDYAVVGDGTHRLTAPDRGPTTARLESVPEGPGDFLLTYDQYRADDAGETYRPSADVSEDRAYLCGNESTFLLDREAVVDALADTSMPVIHDGAFRWSDELVDRLSR